MGRLAKFVDRLLAFLVREADVIEGFASAFVILFALVVALGRYFGAW